MTKLKRGKHKKCSASVAFITVCCLQDLVSWAEAQTGYQL